MNDDEPMTGDRRDAAARALLELIGKGPGQTFPFPAQDYERALAVVDALTAMHPRPFAVGSGGGGSSITATGRGFAGGGGGGRRPSSKALIPAALDGDRGVLIRAVEMIRDAEKNARQSGIPLDDSDLTYRKVIGVLPQQPQE